MKNDEKEIGGYFGLELPAKKEYYDGAIKLNSARNCLKYIIHAQQPTKLYMPSYMQKGMYEDSIRDLVELEFYNINEHFELSTKISLKKGEKILYNNYFASKDLYIEKLAKEYKEELIIDNTHSFFSKPLPGVDTLYSLGSKYFGVPGGGYLFTNKYSETDFEQDYSYAKMAHMIGRSDTSASEFFDEFQESMKSRGNQPIRYMSQISQVMLASIDYGTVKTIRERNFYYLHGFLKDHNELNSLDFSQIEGPMVYPFLITNENLRQELVRHKIYVPTFWKEVIDFDGANDFEKNLAKYLLPLPIDQRYKVSDMKTIIETIFRFIK